MRRALGTMVLLAVVVGAVGYYRGWFVAQTSSSPGQSNISVTVDKDAIKSDADAAAAKARAAADKIEQKVHSSSAPATQG